MQSISSETQRANERYLYIELAAISIAFAIEWYYLNVYALRLGATPIHLGVLASGRALLMVLGSSLSNRWQMRYKNAIQALRFIALFYRTLFYLGIALVPLLQDTFLRDHLADVMVVMVLLSAVPTGIAQGVFLGMLPNASSEHRLATIVSRRSIIMNGGVLAGLVLFGQLLPRVPQPLNYQIGFGIAYLGAFVGWWFLCRIRVPDMPPEDKQRASINVWAFAPFRNFMIVVGMVNTSVFMAGPLIPLQLVQGLNASDGWISVFGMFEMAAGVALLMFMPSLIRRFGTRRLIIATAAATLFQMLILGLETTLPPYILGELIFGAGWFGVNVLLYNRLVEIVPARDMRSYASMYQTVVNASLFAGPLLGTVLIEIGISVPAALLICGVLRGISAYLAWSVRVESPQTKALPVESPRPIDA